jgi:kynurenine--oxoglutarate transaminase/cysteine-S-conjugate beta-lyase/glutamine--phenylpyruvate transaminase
LDRDELESLFNPKTKAIIINTPQNPLGKVFTLDELTHIADLCKKWNVVCISDEVYEWLVYDSRKHTRMGKHSTPKLPLHKIFILATLPDMWQRTLTIGSAGKSFGVTGWKLGWVYGPDYLIKNLQRVVLTCIRAGNTFLQVSQRITCDTCRYKFSCRKLQQFVLKKNYHAWGRRRVTLFLWGKSWKRRGTSCSSF